MTSSSPQPTQTNFRMQVWPRVRNYIAGYFSGVALVFVGHPFDTIKVRLQIEGNSSRFRGPIHCLSETVKKEGVYGLYKGMSPPLVMTGIVNFFLFGIQSMCVEVIKDRNLVGPDPVRQSMLGAIWSGAIISVLVTPMEGIKSRLQMQYAAKAGAAPLYAGPWDCVKKVYQQLGMSKGIYRGWAPVALCRMMNWSYFGGYQYFKQMALQRQQHATGATMPSVLSLSGSVFAGGMAGTCYWMSCYPLDVLKARLLAAPDVQPPVYRGIAHAAQTIYHQQGIKGFFRGFTPCLVRSFPANGACFLAFEVVMQLLPK